MAWIKTIDPDSADGPLAEVYAAAVQRAGNVYNILRLQSLNPAVLASGIAQYLAVMFKPSPLSRAQRELIATVVSRANNCHY